jgi:hypothetical protein
MPRFIFLIYGDEAVWDGWDEAEGAANVAAHARFNALAGGAVKGGGEVRRSRTAVTLRRGDDGSAAMVAGPYAGDASAALGGYYVLECPDLEAAVALAAELPEAVAPRSGVEVREFETG